MICQFYFIVYKPSTHILALKMVKKMTGQGIAISQKMKGLKFNNFNVIFNIDKAKICYLLFFGMQESIFVKCNFIKIM